MSEGYQEGHLVVDPLEKAKEKEGSAVDDKSTQKYYANAPDGEILPNQGAEDEEAEVDDSKDTSKLGGTGSLLGRLQGVEGGLEGGAEPNACLRRGEGWEKNGEHCHRNHFRPLVFWLLLRIKTRFSQKPQWPDFGFRILKCRPVVTLRGPRGPKKERDRAPEE